MKVFLILLLPFLFLTGCNNIQEVIPVEEDVSEEQTYEPVPINMNEEELKVSDEPMDSDLQGVIKKDKQKETKKNETNGTNINLSYMDDEEKYEEQYNKAVIHTSLGDIRVKLYNDDSPVTVRNFVRLSIHKFYDNTKFHRIIEDFMIQGGCPFSKDDNWRNDGTGGPGYTFKDEINDHLLVKGSLAMANSGPNTNGSQFFIVTADEATWLDGKHTNFGKVTEGMDIVKKIEKLDTDKNDHPMEDVIVTGIDVIKIDK